MRLSEARQLALTHRWAGSRNEEEAWRISGLWLQGADLEVKAICATWVAVRVGEWVREGWSAGTINRRLSALSVMLRVARELGGVKTPAIVLPWRQEPPVADRWPTRGEVTGILQTLRDDDHRAAVRVLIETGLRLGELLSLSWCDVESDAVTVRRTKNGTTRRVPLTDQARSALERIMGRGHTGPFQHLTPSTLRKAWDAANRQLGLPYRLHDLRHACASRLVKAGTPLPVVQKWLGHRDLASTMRYVHVRDDQLDAAAKLLEKE